MSESPNPVTKIESGAESKRSHHTRSSRPPTEYAYRASVASNSPTAHMDRLGDLIDNFEVNASSILEQLEETCDGPISEWRKRDLSVMRKTLLRITEAREARKQMLDTEDSGACRKLAERLALLVAESASDIRFVEISQRASTRRTEVHQDKA